MSVSVHHRYGRAARADIVASIGSGLCFEIIIRCNWRVCVCVCVKASAMNSFRSFVFCIIKMWNGCVAAYIVAPMMMMSWWDTAQTNLSISLSSKPRIDGRTCRNASQLPFPITDSNKYNAKLKAEQRWWNGWQSGIIAMCKVCARSASTANSVDPRLISMQINKMRVFYAKCKLTSSWRQKIKLPTGMR